MKRNFLINAWSLIPLLALVALFLVQCGVKGPPLPGLPAAAEQSDVVVRVSPTPHTPGER